MMGNLEMPKSAMIPLRHRALEMVVKVDLLEMVERLPLTSWNDRK